jgi:hypothetical protein
MVKGYKARKAILAKASKSVLIEFAKGAVFSEYTALAERYGAERNGLGTRRLRSLSEPKCLATWISLARNSATPSLN